MSLSGKASIVTGSTSGIGLGVAKALAKQGSSIVLNGFASVTEIDQLQSMIADEYNVPVIYHPADMSKPNEIANLVATAAEEFGRVDVLVNNAGIQHLSPVETFPKDKWDQILAINLSAVFHGVQSVLPLMRKQGWGRIVNIASAHGQVASINKAAYVAAKHGVLGLTKVVALETATSNITCNAICPGWVKTPLVEDQIENLARRENIAYDVAKDCLLSEKQPSGEFVTTGQIGDTVLFLCSESACQIRGAAINIDGGWVAQ